MEFYIANILLCFVWTVIVVNGSENYNQSYDYIIFLGESQSSHDVSDRFLSFALDASELNEPKKVERFKNLMKNDTFINLGQHLKPAYLRFGGSSAQNLTFKQEPYMQKYSDVNVENYSNNIENNSNTMSITSEIFLSLYEFSRKIGSRIMFDLNVLPRNPDGSWKSTNARELISFSKEHDLEIDWQLGNEPNSFPHVFNISIPPEQLAADFCTLRKILNKSGYKKSILVGPEANRVGIVNDGSEYVKNFLKAGRYCVDFATWHQYYLDGQKAKKEDFLNRSVFERLPDQIGVMKEAVRLSGQDIPMWISETSSAYSSGAPRLSDRYLAGFMWLDKLGHSAKEGIQLIIRQSLFGGNYALVGYDLQPNPDYWVAVLFKKFVSSRVLNYDTFSRSENLRFYAHCAKKSTGSEVVIYGYNLNGHEKTIVLKDAPQRSKIFSYVLTSRYLQSKNILLNGELLQFHQNGSIPHFHKNALDPQKALTLPRYSMVFLLIDGLDVPACQE